MRRMIIVVAAAILLPGLAWGQAAPSAQAQAIEDVITRQIEAFRHDDPAAFAFATPELQTMFGNADHFMGMVRGMYAPVYRPRSFVFGTLAMTDGSLVQEVGLIGPDGTAATALYTMEQQPDGSWKIAACRLVTRPTVDS